MAAPIDAILAHPPTRWLITDWLFSVCSNTKCWLTKPFRPLSPLMMMSLYINIL